MKIKEIKDLSDKIQRIGYEFIGIQGEGVFVRVF